MELRIQFQKEMPINPGSLVAKGLFCGQRGVGGKSGQRSDRRCLAGPFLLY